MTTELPKAYDPALIEEKWARYWVEQRLFDVATPTGEAAARNTFTQLLPPPNVTGRLHMGHMLNQTEMDILTRWHRMMGETSLWVPGTDHAGIATQMMVERLLAAEGKTTRRELGREAFITRVKQWKEEYGGAITEQMRRLGASVDWSREYYTMDENLNVAVREAFIRLYEQGLIYRGAYIVNWDPQIQTAVSDLEVESEERAGHLFHVRYDLADGTGSITIATTRPETMLGDTAVAVNPTDERYTAFVGKSLTLPLSATGGKPGREIPVLADDWANPEFGTGAVKVTPAHDPNDFAIGKRHGLPAPLIMDAEARIDLPDSPYHGLDRFEARQRIVADLDAAGYLVKVEDHTLTLPISQRTGAVIEPRLSLQWFLAVNKEPAGATTTPAADSSGRGPNSVAARAVAAVRSPTNPDGPIKFTPEMYSKTFHLWMDNIYDWCISRQLWWGHRIPAWHCGACAHINVAREAPPACTACGSTTLEQETDVLDTWFSSALLPFTAFGWDGSGTLTADLAAFYPTELLVTGFDILFFWVARMIMLGTHLMTDVPLPNGSRRTLADTVPFRNVYIHALVRDANREKMSKTKGNVIDPIGIVEKYGTDAVRFTLASQASPGTDIAFSEARTEGNRAFANKIWNAARFLHMQIERGREAGYTVTLRLHDSFALELPEHTPLETRWIFARLGAVSAEVARALEAYRFDEAASAIYQFFWGEFCDWYLELVKLRLVFPAAVEPDAADAVTAIPAELNDVTELTLGALVTVFEAALRLLSPFMPFLTEELWHALYSQVDAAEPPAKSIALTRYPQAADFAGDAASAAAMTTLQELIVTVRALRKDLAVPEKEPAPIQIAAVPAIAALALANADMLARMARVASVEVVPQTPTGANARATGSFDVAVVYERQIDVAAERERLEKDIAKFTKGLLAAEKQLGSESFLAKAPAHIVDGLKKQSEETRSLREKAEAALASLPVA